MGGTARRPVERSMSYWVAIPLATVGLVAFVALVFGFCLSMELIERKFRFDPIWILLAIAAVIIIGAVSSALVNGS